MKRLALILCLLIWPMIAWPVQSWATSLFDHVTLTGPLTQGSLIVGTAPAGSSILFEGTPVMITPEGVFIFGFNRDHAAEATLALTLADGQAFEETLTVTARDYQIQSIDGLPPSTVTPPQEVLDRIRTEAGRVWTARETVSDQPLFMGKSWQWPSRGIITGVYGSQRTLNGEPRRPHFGIDIAAPTGTPVRAPIDGIISFAEDDLYYSGGTLIIDHGLGLSSTFLHMARIDVAPGQRVQQGDVIGTVGSTGRSTGPHLDWRINWFQERLDPSFLVSPKPEPVN